MHKFEDIPLHVFKNSNLGNAWRIHPSYKKSVEFQRLEFLGDKILAFAMADQLFKNKNLNEGQLSIRLSALVSKDTIAQRARFLIPHIICSGDLTTSMLCDCTEAYIAAVYLDGSDVFKIIYEMWHDILNKPFAASKKNVVQEILQRHNLFPQYTYVVCDGQYICNIHVVNKPYSARGVGVSKKIASLNAANCFLNKYAEHLRTKN
jgi:ribonuclease-3